MGLEHLAPPGGSSASLIDRPPPWNNSRHLVFILDAFTSRKPVMSDYPTDNTRDGMSMVRLLCGPVPAFICWTLSVDESGEAPNAPVAQKSIRELLSFYRERGQMEPVLIAYAPRLNERTLMELAESGASVIADPLLEEDLEPLGNEQSSGFAEVQTFLRKLWESEAITPQAPYVWGDRLFAWIDSEQPKEAGRNFSFLPVATEKSWRDTDVEEDYEDIVEIISV